jgi:micrococcal nuclease
MKVFMVSSFTLSTTMRCALNRLRAFALGTAFVLALLPVTTYAQSAFTVVQVVDGDTLDVQTAAGVLRIRMTGIDAPESCNEATPDGCKKRPSQPSGQLAKRSFKTLIEGKSVQLECQPNADRYGRNLCLVFHNGVDVGAAMLQAGLAWVYKSKYTPANYSTLEQGARDKRLGLWAEGNPIRPSEWRKQCWEFGNC